MKRILSILLVLSIVCQTFLNVGIGVYYHLNKAYISQKLCENRNRPQMHCNGHCYLSKQLKKAEQSEKQSTRFMKEQQEIISSQTKGIGAHPLPLTTLVESFILFDSSLYLSNSYSSLIKPPAA